jgi:hypothetical protein
VYHAGTASTLRLSVTVEALCPPALSFFPPPLGSYWYIQPSAECLVAGQRAPFARVRRRWTASTLRLSVTEKPPALRPFLFFRPRWGPTAYIQPSAERLVAGQRAPFARVRRRWTASTLRLSVTVEALCPLAFSFSPPRWGPTGISSLRPSASSLDSEHPSPECVVAGQRAPFARVHRRWNSEHPSPECHRRSSLPSGSFLFSAPAGVLTGISSLRPSASSLDSEHPSPERVVAWTASTLRLSVTVEALCPPALSFFSASAGVLLVYPAFGRVPRRWTASTLRQSASSLDSEHPSPECHRRSSLPSGPFSFFAPAGVLTGISSLRPSASSLDSEHPSPECVVAGQRAPFARVHHAGTASTLRLSVTVEALCPPAFSFFFASLGS